MTRPFVRGNVGFVIFRAHQAMRQEMYRRFAALGLVMTPEQWELLVRLWERDGRTQNQLSEETLRDKHTISRMLDLMEARGWLERRPDPADGRGRLIFLTRAGLELEATLAPAARQLVEDVLRGIAPEELELTVRTLRRMSENLERREGRPS
jgi:DNA-binding MarR family transcriptional regulator